MAVDGCSTASDGKSPRTADLRRPVCDHGGVTEIPRGTLQEQTFYEQVGGEETFRRLVHHFYQGVAGDPLLRPMYPEEDLGPAEERLALFLMQYWGGPRTYSDNRGHPGCGCGTPLSRWTVPPMTPG